VNAAITTLQGGSFTIGADFAAVDARVRRANIKQTSANITATDTFASNGVIHTLDRVLLPASNQVLYFHLFPTLKE